MNNPPEPPRAGRLQRLDPRLAVGGLAVAAILLLIAIGLTLSRGSDDSLAAASPSPTSIESPGASASGGPEPSSSVLPSMVATASPGRTSGPTDQPAVALLPVVGDSDAVVYGSRFAAAPDAGVYAMLPDERGAVLTLLDVHGDPRPGWPIRLTSRWCSYLLTAGDGSVRVVCEKEQADEGLQAPEWVAFGIDAKGGAIAGWPVEVEGSIMTAAMAGSKLALIVQPYEGDAPPDDSATFVLAHVDPRGRLRTGDAGVSIQPRDSEDFQAYVGPDGTGYVFTRSWAARRRTDVTAFGFDGPLGGWPLRVDGLASDPSFDDEARLHLTGDVYSENTSDQPIVIDPDGPVMKAAVEPLRIDQTSPWSGAGEVYPRGPLLGRRLSFFFGNHEAASVDAFTRVGLASGPTPDWPYDAPIAFQERGSCGNGDTGCGTFTVAPAASRNDVVYFALSAPARSAGGSLVAVGAEGRIVQGWPVGLTRPGSAFWDVVAASDGGVWALAVEDAAGGQSATLLSIAPDSTVRGKRTLVEP